MRKANHKLGVSYDAWLGYPRLVEEERLAHVIFWTSVIAVKVWGACVESAVRELVEGLTSYTGKGPDIEAESGGRRGIIVGTWEDSAEVRAAFSLEERASVTEEGYRIRSTPASIIIAGKSGKGVLYGVFHFLRMIGTGANLSSLDEVHHPVNELRMVNQWDNLDGSIERGYAGRSIFYRNGEIVEDLTRIQDYARLLASVGLNAIAINNVNVHEQETKLITGRYLPRVARIADVFRRYGIRTFLSINFAGPVEEGKLLTADPLDPSVQDWWSKRAGDIYQHIPDFGGFLVKADSEFRPGPFTYGRDHADGANMLADALGPHGGIVIWRCFVYNCKQDWRDRKTDRARAAYDHFTPLDGRFRDNVILQVKNGPMDFQVREPVSPLFGAMPGTNMMIEFQVTQEYTGQQRHLCYLVPQWKEAMDFDTYVQGAGSPVSSIVSGNLHGNKHGGFAAVSNIGDETNWTGHPLAQANLYGFGRLAWNPELTAAEIAEEWVKLTFGGDERVLTVLTPMLLDSWSIYESYTAPLGVGWMVKPNHHYGPDVDGYEYSMWGTYHFADRDGVGVNRTIQSGTGYAGQYASPNAERYESLSATPDELLLFFHHVPYTHVLSSGMTVIQHIYDSHFEGAVKAGKLVGQWKMLEGVVEEEVFAQVEERLVEQALHAREWRDVINTYFWRKSGIPDSQGRVIY